MATWVRQGTGTAPSSTGADLTGTYNLDNGTAPPDFDPSDINSVRIQYTITGASFIDDVWINPRVAELQGAGGSLEILAVIDGTNAVDLQNEASTTDETDNTPDLSFTVADWEEATLEDASPNYGVYTIDMKNDDGTLVMSALTVTIDYNPTSVDYTESETEAVGVTDSTTRVAPAERTPTDDADVTDLVEPVKSVIVAITEAIGVTDGTVEAQDHGRSITDPVGVTDLTTKSETGAEEVVEAVGITDSVLHVDPTLDFIYPDGDILSGGWETAPTAGQPLADQLDEDPADDADYIFEEV